MAKTKRLGDQQQSIGPGQTKLSQDILRAVAVETFDLVEASQPGFHGPQALLQGFGEV